MLIEGKQYSYRQLMEETGLSRSTLHQAHQSLKRIWCSTNHGEQLYNFLLTGLFTIAQGNFYSSKTDYAIKNNIPYYEMFQNSNSDTNTD